MPARLPITLVATIIIASVGQTAEPPVTSHDDLDRIAVDVLKDLHNRGADLYNAADAAGAARTYETVLRSVGPFLTHRPKVQAAIANGLVEAAKLDGAKAQAYRLHEIIDEVRNELKTPGKSTPPIPGPKKPEPPTPPPPAVGSLAGVLTLDGQPVPKAAVTIVSLTLPDPRVFTTVSDEVGKFAFATELPTATYAVMVSGGLKATPVKFQSTRTSGLEVVDKSGNQTSDLNLQSK